MREDERRLRFDVDDNDDIYRTQTVTDPHRLQRHQQRDQEEGNRRRSGSDPTGRGRQRPRLAIVNPRRDGANARMVRVPEDTRTGTTAVFNAPGGRNSVNQELADVLDVIDPEVSTLNNVTNIQNSLFVPSLGRFINRRPTYTLTQAPAHVHKKKAAKKEEADTYDEGPRAESPEYDFDFNHAVLPEGVSLEGWTKEEMAELNDHVRHMLHSRRSKFKRAMKAFGQYVRKPLGLFVTVYATLITLFGAAWVLFLIGWIYVGAKTPEVVNDIDYVLVALFGLVGDGLAPFRLVDTYHMIFIAHYYRKTWRIRKRMQMAALKDKNDLPTSAALEEAHDEISVLNPTQEASLVYHQNKFAKSHTFYRPHETKTHYAFPLSYLMAIVILLDLHSCLQISLGATTWGINWHTRNSAITPTILSVSITVNITAGILINIGGRKTRKKEVVERMFRQDLTREALEEIRNHGEETGDTEKKVKAERAILEGRQSETLDEAMKSHVPIRESIDGGRRSFDVRRTASDMTVELEKEGSPRRSLDVKVRHSLDSRRPLRKPEVPIGFGGRPFHAPATPSSLSTPRSFS
ncbi:hypothetical protein F5Y16DRAFT_373891 [Xylariaceae sp. FL0255]|nr:hypothetical protein F5Y16DRAFT_373891 [Xylariaceae sp. FL0255]